VRLDRVLAIARKNLRSLKHDRRTVGFLVLMPLLMIAIFGYTFGGDVKNLPVFIVNLDTAPSDQSVASAIISDLMTRNTMDIKSVYDRNSLTPDLPAVVREAVKDTKVKAAIVFGPNFTRDVTAAVAAITNGTHMFPATFTVYIDGTNPNIVTAIANDIQISILKAVLSEGLTPAIAPVPDLVYGQDAKFIAFFAPGVMGLAAMMVTFILSIISFVHERSTSTLDRLLSTPVTEGEIVAGYALAFGLVGLMQSIVILTAAVLLFQIAIVGSVLLTLLVIFIFGIGNQGLGFLLSSVAKNEFQAVQFMPIILFPSILLSGVFWPLEAVPTLLQPVSYAMPLTYAVDALRSVMIRGWSLTQIAVPLVILVAFAIIMLSLSAYGLRKRR